MFTKVSKQATFAAAVCMIALAAWIPTGCGGHKTTTSVSQALLSGTVLDANDVPVVGATVATPSATIKATTDTLGHYVLSVTAAALDNTGLVVTADNYASTSRRVPSAATTQNFVLRGFDSVTPITLPTGAAASVTAVAARGDGNVTLTIPANALITPTGDVATGDAEVRLTYWNPVLDMANAPATMAATVVGDGNGPYTMALQSLGMVDVQIVQNQNQLQVAPGMSLGLDHALPDAFRQAMAQRPNDMGGPYLFYFDANATTWSLSGNVTYAENEGTLQSQLPHLTVWNWDNFANWNPPASCTTTDLEAGNAPCNKPAESSVGGCLTGTILDSNNNALPNQAVRLWLFDFESILAIDLVTDAKGMYCANVGTRVCVPTYNNKNICDYSTNTISYLVSSPESSDDSSMANPIPQSCRPSSGSYSGAISYVNSCSLVADDNPILAAQPVSNPPLSTLATATVNEGTYCGSNTCTVLPNVSLSNNGNKTVGGTTQKTTCASPLSLGTACTTATASCCVSGTSCTNGFCCDKVRTAGQSCLGAAGCCGSGSTCNKDGSGAAVCCDSLLKEGDTCGGDTASCCASPLVCSDYVCVPPA